MCAYAERQGKKEEEEGSDTVQSDAEAGAHTHTHTHMHAHAHRDFRSCLSKLAGGLSKQKIEEKNTTTTKPQVFKIP